MSITHHIKALSKDSLIYGSGFALNGLIGLIIAPILTHIFAPEDFGAITLVQTVIGFLGIFVGLNLSSGVFRYYYEYEDVEIRKKILSTALIFFILSGIFYFLLVWTTAPYLQNILSVHSQRFKVIVSHYDYTRYFRILSISLFFSILDLYFRSLLRNSRRPYHFVIVSFSQVLISLLLITWFVYYKRYGIDGVLWSNVLSSAIVSLIGFSFTFRQFEFTFSRPLLLKIFSYCLPQFPSGILAWLLSQSSPFLLNYYSTLTEQGYFAVAARMATMILLFSNAFRLAWDPFAFSIMKKADAPIIYSRIYGFYYVGMGLIGAVIALFSKPILIILTPTPYHSAYTLVFMIIAMYIIQEGNNMLGIGIGISKKTKFISYAQFISYSAYLICAILLIPRFGAVGATISIVAGMYFQSATYYYFANRVYPIPYKFWRSGIFLISLFAIVGVELGLVARLELWDSILIAILFTPLVTFHAFRFGLNYEERIRLTTLIKQRLIKICRIYS